MKHERNKTKPETDVSLNVFYLVFNYHLGCGGASALVWYDKLGMIAHTQFSKCLQLLLICKYVQ